MNAFWSTTDNNNDKSGIYYSGVIGKLTPDNYEYVIRFNLYEDKKTCTLDEIFDMPVQESPKVPNAWLDQVKINPPVSFPSKFAKGSPNSPAFKKGSGSYLEDDSRLDPRDHMWNEWIRGQNERYNRMGTGGFDPYDFEEIRVNPKTGTLDTSDYVPGPMDENEDTDPVGVSGEFEFNVTQYGVDIAEAKDSIEIDLLELEGEDDLLVDVMRTIFSMLSESGRTQIQTNGL